MNQEERRQRRQKDTKSAVIVCVIVVLILLVLAAGGVFLVGRLLPKGGGQNEGTDGTELLASLDHACGHACLCSCTPNAGVVGLLVADLAVNPSAHRRSC